MITAQSIFDMTCDLISKRSANGTIDAGKTATYRARSLGLLTLWQNEIELSIGADISDPITNLSQAITVDDRVSGPYYLAAKLVLIEDPGASSYFEQKADELKNLFMRRQKAVEVVITDVYGFNEVEGV